MDEVRLTVPAAPGFIHLLRAVVSSVGARQNLSLDAIDDLQIAVDEAASFLLALPDAEQITLRVGLDGSHIVARIAVVSESEWPPPRVEDGLAWKVMAGLTDEAGFEIDDGQRVIRLVKIPDVPVRG